MKNLFSVVFFLISALSNAQSNGAISGVLTDAGSVKEPLILAKVLVKETGAESLSDENGNFKFENLKEGTYTLICSFIGYEQKELETVVVSGKTSQVELALAASTVSLDDLMLTLARADSESNSAATASK